MLDMLPALRERWEGLADYTKFRVKILPSANFLNEPAFVGSWSITASKTKRRWSAAKVQTDIEDMFFSPSELARVYLSVKYPDRKKRMTGEQLRACRAFLPSPLFARRGRWGECSYLDIRAAYWSIINLVGWNVDYHPQKWLKLGVPPSDFPYQENKLARNCLVSLTLPSKITFWTGKKYTIKHSYNPHLNPPLYRVVMDVLQGVAYDLRLAGAVYCHTDGFIVPDKHVNTAKEIITSWGLNYSIKAQGDTEVYSTGSYRVGRSATKIIHTHAGTVSNIQIEPDLVEWLRKRLYACSRLTIR